MAKFARIYAVFIVLYALFTILIILASPHGLKNIDTDLLVIAFGSLAMFPATGVSLSYSFAFERKTTMMLYVSTTLVSLTGLVFIYYTYQFWSDEYSAERSFYHYVPIVVTILSVVLIRELIQKIRNHKT